MKTYPTTYQFDFEDFIDTDINGCSQEIHIDGMIEQTIELIKEEVPPYLQQQALNACKNLWIKKIELATINTEENENNI
jgi:hypothetical protein